MALKPCPFFVRGCLNLRQNPYKDLVRVLAPKRYLFFVRPRTNSARGFAYDFCCQNHKLNQQNLLSNPKFVNGFKTDSGIGMKAATLVWELASWRNVLVVLVRQRRAHG